MQRLVRGLLGIGTRMNRRDFLLGTGTLMLSQLITGCGGDEKNTLKVRLLKDSLPTQLISDFQRQTQPSPALNFSAKAQLKEIFELLEAWQKPDAGGGWSLPFTQSQKPVIPNLVTLGDYWLKAAIEQKLIQPLATDKLKNWPQLPPQWQELVKRNDKGEPYKTGNIWGAPYRWGSTVIAYRRDKFESLGLKPPTDWSDLWREELRDRISVLDRYREAIGLTLKYLGQSYNTPDLERVSNLKDALKKLHRQVKLYSADNYLQPLILGDTWLAVAWSSDILEMKLKGSDRQISAVIPQSGTALWADLWVKPATNEANPNFQLPEAWIDFCWQPQSAQAISQFTSAASPILLDLEPKDISQTVRENPLLVPDAQILKNSEFILPLFEATDKKYRALWQEIRQK